jgi:hypothetical protein
MYKKQTLFAVLAIQFCFFQSQAQTIYVNAAQATNGDGVTWATAFNNLQSAIDVATLANEIWVTQGTYYPSKDRFGVATPTDVRTKTFYINKNIKVFGGFLGTETAFGQRDINNTTILSGDIGIVNDIVDNAYHIVYIDGSSSNGNIDNSCILNGFKINGGNANGSSSMNRYGGGLFCDAFGAGKSCNPLLINNIFKDNIAFYNGGAIANFGFYGVSSPFIINCYFLNNKAESGGAIFNYSVDNGICSPIITKCFFGGNIANSSTNSSAGAIFNSGFKGESSPIITNSTFLANISLRGGAIMNFGYGDGTLIGKSSPFVANCVFSNNLTSNNGGAIYNIASGGINQPIFSNCTFSQNNATTQGQAVYNFQNSTANSISNLILNNCIFSDNPGGKLEVYNFSSTVTLKSCIYSDGTLDGTISPQTGNTFTNCIEADPKFVNASSVAGADGIYRTIDDGLSLQLGSPAINAGDNSLFPSGLATNSIQKSAKILSPNALTTDITNTVTRILETTIDMGAYETNFSAPLPLNLLQFTVTYKNEEAILNWKTSNEINTHSFEIERSVDGKSFNKIGTEKAKNNTEIQNYQFADATINNMDDKNIYYRLKQFDLDGSHVYSKIIALAIKDRNNITISPNPVSTIAKLNIGKENELINTKMMLYDLQGKQIEEFDIQDSIEQINLTNLPKGMYLIKFKNDKTVKFLKD